MQEQEENEKSVEKSQKSEKYLRYVWKDTYFFRSEEIQPSEKEVSAVEAASETQRKEVVDEPQES